MAPRRPPVIIYLDESVCRVSVEHHASRGACRSSIVVSSMKRAVSAMNAVAPNGIWRAFSKLRSRFRAVHTAAQLQARGARAGPRAMLTQRHANVQTPAVAGGRLLKATSPAQAAATRAGSPNKPPADAPTKDKSCDGFRAREDEKENIDPVTGARARLASGRAAASAGASPSRVVPALSSFRLDSAIWFFFFRASIQTPRLTRSEPSRRPRHRGDASRTLGERYEERRRATRGVAARPSRGHHAQVCSDGARVVDLLSRLFFGFRNTVPDDANVARAARGSRRRRAFSARID
jgi:hypothetical protein